MPNLDDIIWAAIVSRDPMILAEASTGNRAYLDIIGNEKFLETLRYHPQDLDVNKIRSILVNFLNKWGCRLRNYDTVTACNLKDCIVGIHPELISIQNYSILDFDFEDLGATEKITGIFSKFWTFSAGSEIAKNFGSTATSKTLHIVNPNLFTMWDDEIRYQYGFIMGSGSDYLEFSKEIWKISGKLVNESNERYGTGDPALFLSQRLNINPSFSLVKFIDEFNWLTHTRKLSRPADWVPHF